MYVFLLTSNKHLAYSYLVIVTVRITLRKWKLSWVSVWLDVVVVVVVAFWCALLHTSIPIQLHKHLLITGNLISLRVIATWCTRRIMSHRSSVCQVMRFVCLCTNKRQWQRQRIFIAFSAENSEQIDHGLGADVERSTRISAQLIMQLIMQ